MLISGPNRVTDNDIAFSRQPDVGGMTAQNLIGEALDMPWQSQTAADQIIVAELSNSKLCRLIALLNHNGTPVGPPQGGTPDFPSSSPSLGATWWPQMFGPPKVSQPGEFQTLDAADWELSAGYTGTVTFHADRIELINFVGSIKFVGGASGPAFVSVPQDEITTIEYVGDFSAVTTPFLASRSHPTLTNGVIVHAIAGVNGIDCNDATMDIHRWTIRRSNNSEPADGFRPMVGGFNFGQAPGNNYFCQLYREDLLPIPFHAWKYFQRPEQAEIIVIRINDPNNPDGFIRAGSLFVGDAYLKPCHEQDRYGVLDRTSVTEVHTGLNLRKEGALGRYIRAHNLTQDQNDEALNVWPSMFAGSGARHFVSFYDKSVDGDVTYRRNAFAFPADVTVSEVVPSSAGVRTYSKTFNEVLVK